MTLSDSEVLCSLVLLLLLTFKSNDGCENIIFQTENCILQSRLLKLQHADLREDPDG